MSIIIYIMKSRKFQELNFRNDIDQNSFINIFIYIENRFQKFYLKFASINNDFTGIRNKIIH